MAGYNNGFLNTNSIPRIRRSPSKTFASGKHAISICDRCGQKYDWKDLSLEPGTNWRVCSDCNDKFYSLVCHPQNFTGIAAVDAQALPWSRPDLAPGPNGLDSTAPWYIATLDGYLVEFEQETVVQTGTSEASGGTQFPNELNWGSGPFGYD